MLIFFVKFTKVNLHIQHELDPSLTVGVVVLQDSWTITSGDVKQLLTSRKNSNVLLCSQANVPPILLNPLHYPTPTFVVTFKQQGPTVF